jgi:type VI protein secretion system component Hcp
MSRTYPCGMLLACVVALSVSAADSLAQRAAGAPQSSTLHDGRSGDQTTLRASADFFLAIEGVPGESRSAGTPHRDHIEIESWSWGVSDRAMGSGSGGSIMIEVRRAREAGSGMASGRRGVAGPSSIAGLATGDALGILTLEAHTTRGEEGWVRYALHNVRVGTVQSLELGGANYERIELTYDRVTVQRAGRSPAGLTPVAATRAAN